MRIIPGPPGTGIVFRRVDLDGFEIEAISRNVARVSYATSLMKKGVLISTTEHLLSAFIGVGIDNAIVELDNLELPILDGSALPFVELIQKAGIRKQRRPRKYLKILREVEMREGNKFISVYPADSYSVSYSINFPHPLIGKETLQVELSNGSYLRKIAAPRTFGSREDEKAMRNMGLIRCASRENCIVLTRDAIENGPLLSFPKHDPRPHICHSEYLSSRTFCHSNSCHSESASFADEESAIVRHVRQHRIPRAINPRHDRQSFQTAPLLMPGFLIEQKAA